MADEELEAPFWRPSISKKLKKKGRLRSHALSSEALDDGTPANGSHLIEELVLSEAPPIDEPPEPAADTPLRDVAESSSLRSRRDQESVADSASVDYASDSSSVSQQVNPRQGQYQSSLFKVRVGPKKEQFTAHADVLARSPKLDKQCNGRFSEAANKRIMLPDHDPRIFALLLEFLYKGDYWPFLGEEFDASRSEDEDVRATQLQREGDLYCLADEYQLDSLQELAVKKMQMLTPITFESFLSVSEYVYDKGGTRGPFREYFRQQIEGALLMVAHEPWLLEVIARGGDLAQDLFLSGRDPPPPRDLECEDGGDEPAVKVVWK